MKLRLILYTLLAALGMGCSSAGPQKQGMKVLPLLAIRHSTSDSLAYYQLGRYYQGQLRLEKAEQAYRTALAADERNVDALNALGTALAAQGNLAEAMEAFEQAIAQAPNVPYVYNNLSYAYLLNGEPQKAYRAVHKALTLDSKMERAWGNLTRIGEQLADPRISEAARSRQLAILPPDDVPIQLVSHPGIENPPVERVALQTSMSSAPEGVTTAKEAGPASVSHLPPQRIAARIEVTNGNGINGYAANIRRYLASQGIAVARLTNFSSFAIERTQVEYRAGFAGAAEALKGRLKTQAVLVEAKTDRPGTDVRLILGRDSATPPARLAGEGGPKDGA